MNNNTHAEIQAEQAFESINQIKRASPKPYLLTRINARLHSPAISTWDNIANFVSRPGIIALGLCLLIGINLAVILMHVTTNTQSKPDYAIAAEEEEYANPYVLTDTENP